MEKCTNHISKCNDTFPLNHTLRFYRLLFSLSSSPEILFSLSDLDLDLDLHRVENVKI